MDCRKRNVLIAIEGIDGSGKGTQAQRLCEWLPTQRKTTALVSFPRYSETHFGATIGRFLNGEFGELAQVDPLLAATLYAADRFESKGHVHELLTKYDVVVADRYVASNMAHQGAKMSGEERARLHEWIARTEFEVFNLPRADLVIHLDLPAKTAQELIARKSKRDYTDKAADLQEADREYLASVRHSYLDLAATDDSWQTVSLLDGERLKSIEEVGGEISALVTAALS